MNNKISILSEYFLKMAGRVKIEKYHKEISEIIDIIQKYFSTKDYFNIGSRQKLIGTVYINFNNVLKELDIYATCSSEAFFVAAFDRNPGGNPKLIINLDRFKFKDYIADLIVPEIAHEFTHFLQFLYDPIYSNKFDESEYKNGKFIGFYKEFSNLLSSSNKYNIDYSNKEIKQDPDKMANYQVLHITKTKDFKELLKKYGLILNKEILGKLIYVAREIYLEDLNFYMTTGGDLFGSESDKDKTKQTIDNSRNIYYNSKDEVSAYLNQIIKEILNNMLTDKTLANILRGHTTLNKEFIKILNNSPGFKDIKDELSNKNIKLIYKEVAKNLLDKLENGGYKTSLEKNLGFSLNSKENLVFKYLMKIYNSNISKFNELISNDEFMNNNRNSILYMNEYLHQIEKMDNLRKSLADILKI